MSFVGYAQGPVGRFLMTRLGPVCITPPRPALNTASGWGISLTQGAGIIGNGLSPLIEGAITARRKTKELTEKSHWGIV